MIKIKELVSSASQENFGNNYFQLVICSQPFMIMSYSLSTFDQEISEANFGGKVVF